MNATEQIALLRRACEMVWDASGNGGDMSDRDWLAKWKATGSPWKIAIDQCRDALSATATPPEDDAARLTKERDALKEEVDWLAREWPSQVAAAIGSTPSMAGATPSMLSGCVQHEVARLTKERDDARLDRSAVLAQRDEALAKLAAAQKELGDAYAAKPEPEFFTEYCTDTFKFNVVRRIRPATSLHLVAQCASGDDAQRIADALNGVKP